MNQTKIIELFQNGEKNGSSTGGNLRIEGDQLIHFFTVIAERHNDKFIINMTNYSDITRKLQKKIIEVIGEENLIKVNKVERDFNGRLSDYI